MTLRIQVSTLALVLTAACITEDEGITPPPDADPGPPDADPSAGPFDDVELTKELELGDVTSEVHVVRDELGVPHIQAEKPADLFFVQGYLTAHDRLPQMDVLRRVGAGRLAELYGETALEQDLEMRMHRMEPLAEEALAELRDSEDPRDAAVLEMLERYTEGVNAYAEALAAGDESVHPDLHATWDPQRFEAWSPVDSLVIGRFISFGLSYGAPRQIEFTQLFDAAHATYGDATDAGEAIAAREGAHVDLARHRPIGRHATVEDVGGSAGAASETGVEGGASRPDAAPELLERSLDTFDPELPPGLDLRSYLDPNVGSNTWALAPSVTGAEAILAGDQHLPLDNPSTFYPTHLLVEEGETELDVEGVSFPGVPGVILGHNGEAAWSSTTVRHDVTDVYRESIVDCAEGEGECVEFEGEGAPESGQVPIETRTETVQIGALGTITETREVTYESVPHHGPIIPTIENGEIVPREGNEALSVRYTGYQPTHEIRAFYDLMFAESVDEAFEAIETFQFGGQNFVVIDNQGDIGWSTHAEVPARAPAAYTFHPLDNPEGLAPWMILPGQGSAEWEGFLAAEDLPRSKNPESGYLVTANSDPVGTTFDGDPLNGPDVEGRPLYFGALYAAGLRTARITARILERVDEGLPVGLDETIETQHDSQSTYGERMVPRMNEAFALLDAESPPSDVANYLSGLSNERTAAMGEAAGVISDWSLETPPAVEGSPSEAEIGDSVATTIFNAWMHHFIERALDDEFRAMGFDGVFDVSEARYVRPAVALMTEPGTLESGLSDDTQQPILCDDMDTEGVVESCDRIALEALESTVEWAESEAGFGTDDMQAWRWGERHTLTLEPLVPNPSLELGPFPRAGGSAVVNVTPTSFADLSMEQRTHGAAQRFIAIGEPGTTLRAKFQLPGGTVYNPDSPHYRDLLDETYLPEVHEDLPYSREEIVAAGNERWLITP